MEGAFFSVAINREPRSHSLGVLFVGHSQTEPRHKVGPQILDHYLIHYIMSGKGTFESRGQTYELTRGDSFVIFPGELVSYCSDRDDPWCYRWIAFTGSQSETILADIGITRQNPCATVADLTHMSHLFEQAQLNLQMESKNSDLRANGYLRLILAQYNDDLPAASDGLKTSEAAHHVAQAKRWLMLQYARPLSIEEMAQNIGYHRTYLSKIFKEQTGQSPSQYLLQIRMERAAQLLQNEQLSIAHIASSVGYEDPLYFSRQFKKWYQQSPSAYRAANRQKKDPD